MKSATYFSEQGNITVYLRKGSTVQKVVKTLTSAEALQVIEDFMQTKKR